MASARREWMCGESSLCWPQRDSGWWHGRGARRAGLGRGAVHGAGMTYWGLGRWRSVRSAAPTVERVGRRRCGDEEHGPSRAEAAGGWVGAGGGWACVDGGLAGGVVVVCGDAVVP